MGYFFTVLEIEGCIYNVWDRQHEVVIKKHEWEDAITR